MKQCPYCGRNNPDQATSCSECGTELLQPSTQNEPKSSKIKPGPIAAFLNWGLGTVVFLICFLLLAMTSTEIFLGNKSIGRGDAGLEALAFIPFLSLTGIVYVFLSLWAFASSWGCKDVIKKRTRVLVTFLCFGALFGIGFGIWAYGIVQNRPH